MKIRKEIPSKTGVVTNNAKAADEGISDAAAALRSASPQPLS